MIHGRDDYNRIQDPAVENPALATGGKPIDINEPVFLLRASDKLASAAVRYWAARNRALPDGDQDAIESADAHADLMDRWHPKKTADI